VKAVRNELYSEDGRQVGRYLHGSESNHNLFVCYRQRGKVALFTNSGILDKGSETVEDLVRINRFTGKIARPIAKDGLFKDKPAFFNFLEDMAGEQDAAIVEAGGFEYKPSEIFKAHGQLYMRSIHLQVLNESFLSEEGEHKQTQPPE